MHDRRKFVGNGEVRSRLLSDSAEPGDGKVCGKRQRTGAKCSNCQWQQLLHVKLLQCSQPLQCAQRDSALPAHCKGRIHWAPALLPQILCCWLAAVWSLMSLSAVTKPACAREQCTPAMSAVATCLGTCHKLLHSQLSHLSPHSASVLLCCSSRWHANFPCSLHCHPAGAAFPALPADFCASHSARWLAALQGDCWARCHAAPAQCPCSPAAPVDLPAEFALAKSKKDLFTSFQLKKRQETRLTQSTTLLVRAPVQVAHITPSSESINQTVPWECIALPRIDMMS